MINNFIGKEYINGMQQVKLAKSVQEQIWFWTKIAVLWTYFAILGESLFHQGAEVV